MKKWLFSNDGEVSGPLELNTAKEFVKKNPDLYAWHPSYTHWMPVTCIEEFNDTVKIPKPPSEIPKELIEQFIVKERTLITKLDDIDKKLDLTTVALSEFDQEILLYKQLTQNCNEEVRATIISIEQQYASLQASLSVFKRSAVLNKSRMSEVVSQFKDQVATKNINDNSTEVLLIPGDINVNNIDKPLNLTENKTELFEDDEKPRTTEPSPASHVNTDLNQAEAINKAQALKDAQALKESEALKEAQALKKAKALKEAHALKESEALKAAQTLKEAEALKAAQTLKEAEALKDSLAIEEQPLEAAKPSALELLEQKLNLAKQKARLAMANDTPRSANSPTPDNLVSMSRVEYVDDVSEHDIFMASKVQQIHLTTTENLATFEKEPAPQDFSGDFDYILKGVYRDNGGIGEVVEPEEGHQKKRRRRRRR